MVEFYYIHIHEAAATTIRLSMHPTMLQKKPKKKNERKTYSIRRSRSQQFFQDVSQRKYGVYLSYCCLFCFFSSPLNRSLSDRYCTKNGQKIYTLDRPGQFCQPAGPSAWGRLANNSEQVKIKHLNYGKYVPTARLPRSRNLSQFTFLGQWGQFWGVVGRQFTHPPGQLGDIIARSNPLLSLSSIVAESWETARLQKKVRETIS